MSGGEDATQRAWALASWARTACEPAHATPQHGARALVHCPPAPRGDPGPLARDARACWGREQDGPHRLGGTHALTVPQALTPRCGGRPPAQKRGARRRLGRERGEAVEAKQWRKQPRLQAAPKRRRAMRHQGTGVARMRGFMRLSHLRELGHNRAQGRVLVEPMGPPLHADNGQPGRKRAARPRRRRVGFATWLGVVALALA